MAYSDIREKIRSGEQSCVDLTKKYLENITACSDLNAFITVFRDQALERAEKIDHKISENKAGCLAGMIMAIKDNLAVCGSKTTCGSKILENFVSPYNATVISKLFAEDVIFIGKTNMDEFGMGSSNENSFFGPVKNPHNRDYITGGSSGGSAAAVASNMAMCALGTDTGGSVRQPAAFNGIVGLRPSYGRVSRYGLVAFASSLDQVGCLTTTTEDTARVLQVMAGKDERDATSSDKPVPDYTESLNRDIKGLHIGLPREFFTEGLNDEVQQAIIKVIDQMKQAGAIVQEVSLPHMDYGISAYYLICTAEASSNLARYDGVRFGLRLGAESGLQSMFQQTRSKGFGDEVKRRIMLGAYVLSAGYYDAYYRKAQKVRTLIKKDYDKVFETCDVIVGPTTPTTAFKIGEKVNDPMSMYLSDVYTVSGPLAGVPALSLPIGKDTRGLPIGMQVTGKAFQEESLLGISNWIEKQIGVILTI